MRSEHGIPRIHSTTVNNYTMYTNICMLLDGHIKGNEVGRECGMQEIKVKYEQGKNWMKVTMLKIYRQMGG